MELGLYWLQSTKDGEWEIGELKRLGGDLYWSFVGDSEIYPSEQIERVLEIGPRIEEPAPDVRARPFR